MYKLFLFLFISSFHNNSTSYAQEELKNIFPFVRNCISVDSTSFCIIRDDIRLDKPNSYYSAFLFYNMSVVDSFSLDEYSNTGATPKSLFVWGNNSKKIFCLEYNEGSGIGHHLIQETKLLLFDITDNKIKNILTIGTDSMNLNTFNNTLFEVNSRIIPFKDTLFVIRTGWNEVGGKSMIKKKVWEYTLSIIMNEGHPIIHNRKGLPYFMIKNNMKK